MKCQTVNVLNHMNKFFVHSLLQLAADPDPNVKNGAELLDRLIKVSYLCK